MSREREITADQYRLQQGGDFDEAWIKIDSDRVRIEVFDVDRELGAFGGVMLDTLRGSMLVRRERTIYVK